LALALMVGAAGGVSAGAEAVSVPAGLSYDARNPPEGVFDDEWSVVKIDGQKAGYAHEVYRREGERIFTETRMAMRVGREASVVEITEEDTTEETVGGEPRGFRSETTMAKVPVVVEGHGDGQAMNVTMESGGYRQEKVVALPAGTLMAWGEERRMRLEGLKAGTHYAFPLYSPADDLLKPLATVVDVGAREKVAADGKTVEATRVDERSAEGGSGVDAVSWVDDDWQTVKLVLPLGGFTAEITPATRAEALADYLPADIFTASLMELGTPVPENATTVTYDLRRTDGQALPRPPESATERSEIRADGSARITLTRGGTGAAAGEKLFGAALAPYLARNSFMDTSDPRLQQLAAEALADAPEGGKGPAPAEVAQRLRDFVSGYIENKDLSVGFATASEVAQTREGDCTEHAVLLAALGRVRGLPTRVVAGLAYMPEYEGRTAILGYHMWAQFYIGGQWVDYDAALPELAGPPRRLGLVASDLDGESTADFSLGMLEWMAGLRVKMER
jgi:hypothetical protein